jgi:hypothetical protein
VEHLPSHSQPTNGETGVEGEQEDCLSDAAIGGLEAVGDRKYNHTDRHSSSTKDHQLSTTEFLDGEDRDPAGNEVFSTIARSNELRVKGRQSNLVLEHCWDVVSDKIDTTDLRGTVSSATLPNWESQYAPVGTSDSHMPRPRDGSDGTHPW